MTTMIERVARAICRAEWGNESQWEMYTYVASYAIAEMRTPTQEMMLAYWRQHHLNSWWGDLAEGPAVAERKALENLRDERVVDDFTTCWQAAVVSALAAAEPTPEEKPA